MDEQTVPYTEPIETRDDGVSANSVPSPMVERAFRVLDLISSAEEGLTLSDLARALNMSKGSMHGLLRTLESCGALEATEERSYVPGPRVYELASAYVRRAGLRRFALPAMRRLAEEIGETVFLGRVEQRGVRIIESVMAERESAGLRISAQRGTRVHLLAGATARVVLASWTPSARQALLEQSGLPRFTERSITETSRFLAEVELTERSGIGIDRGEYLEGVNAVAAPIYGPGRALLALLWIVGFACHLHDEALAKAARLLHTEVEDISHFLGGS